MLTTMLGHFFVASEDLLGEKKLRRWRCHSSEWCWKSCYLSTLIRSKRMWDCTAILGLWRRLAGPFASAVITPIPAPFVENLTEIWESFPNYDTGPGFDHRVGLFRPLSMAGW